MPHVPAMAMMLQNPSAGSGVLRGSSGHLPMSLSLLPALGRTLCLSFPQLLAVNRGYKALFPKIQAREGEMRQEEIRGKAPAVLALTAAAPLGKWETPWKSCFFFFFPPKLSTWVMCWRPEPKPEPTPRASQHRGRGMLTQTGI